MSCSRQRNAAFLNFRRKTKQGSFSIDGIDNGRSRREAVGLLAKDKQAANHQDLTAPFVVLLKACAAKKDLGKGSRIHADIWKRGLLENSPYVASSLISMYAKCGDLEKAQEVLDELAVCDLVSWSALIAGYSLQGNGNEALICYDRMRQEGLSPNSFTFSSLLKACGNIGAAYKGRQIHEEILSQGLLENEQVLGNALVDMFVKCGALTEAQQVLDDLPVRDVFSWSALIAGYTQQEQGEEALNCFEQMKQEGLSTNAVIFSSLLKACGSIKAPDKGKQIFDEIVCENLLGKDVVLGNALVDMYIKCGTLAKAQDALKKLPVRDVITWSAVIAGYSQQDQGEEALNCFEEMQCEGHSPNLITFICILKACSSLGAADKGKQIHKEICNQGLLEKDTAIGTALVDMYAKCGVLREARQVLDELPVRNAVSYNAILTGYAQQAKGEEALICLAQMQLEGISPDAVTFITLLGACSRSCLIDEGQMYLANMSNHGIVPSIKHQTCMVHLFGCIGHFDEVLAVIEKIPGLGNCASWYALLGICQKSGNVKLGQWAFRQAMHVNNEGGSVQLRPTQISNKEGFIYERNHNTN